MFGDSLIDYYLISVENRVHKCVNSSFCTSFGVNFKTIIYLKQEFIWVDCSEFISVYINGVATEVPRGPLDMNAMFGQDLVCVHSSGLPVPINECGFSEQSLQHGESYFLVSNN